MLLPRLLPPQFLVSAWSARQLRRAQRANKSESAFGRRLAQRREVERTLVQPAWRQTEDDSLVQRGEDGDARVDPAAERSIDGTAASEQKRLFVIRRARVGAAVGPGSARESLKPAGKQGKAYETDSGEEQPSIFDELFPEGNGRQSTVFDEQSDAPAGCHVTGLAASLELPKEVSWTTLDDMEDGWIPSTSSKAVEDDPKIPVRRFDSGEVISRRETSVLVLSNASKTLSRSDFDRLIPKGEHIEGWTSGIIKG